MHLAPHELSLVARSVGKGYPALPVEGVFKELPLVLEVVVFEGSLLALAALEFALELVVGAALLAEAVKEAEVEVAAVVLF